ncbi:MAG: YnbE family lipoprotein [Sphingomonadales bacterium]|nr:YnbE family lipoprotein [Sphingomonadales bacterium]
MMPRKLTRSALAARKPAMQESSSSPLRSGRRAVRAAMVLVGGAVACSGCVSVNAPDKPIVIELNINIKQEVIYRLAADAGSTIDANPGIF